MATPMCSLACCCGRAESILAPQADSRKKSAPRQHHPLAPSSAPDAIAPTGPSSPTTPHHPPAAPACQRAAPRAVATAARPMRHCRFTRSIRPPVPRSGSLLAEPANPPRLAPPCQGLGTGNRGSACPSQATRREPPPVSRETLYTASINCGNPISLLRHRYYVK